MQFISIYDVFRKIFSAILGVCATICTALTFWQPAVNAFALMLLVIPTFILLYSALKELVAKQQLHNLPQPFLRKKK